MSDCEIIGLRVRCPKTKKIVNIPRERFAIGPIAVTERRYHVFCDCGKLHTASMRHVDRPTSRAKKFVAVEELNG